MTADEVPMKKIPIELAMSVLRYDPETGRISWRDDVRMRGPVRGGKPAGHVRKDGYMDIKLFGKNYLAHRVAWAMHHGADPSLDLDHINGDRSDNRMCNLRDVSRATNSQNQRGAHKDNPIRLLGVFRSGRAFSSRITVRGAPIGLGTFPTPEAAHAAYIDAKRRLHEGCTL